MLLAELPVSPSSDLDCFTCSGRLHSRGRRGQILRERLEVGDRPRIERELDAPLQIIDLQTAGGEVRPERLRGLLAISV